MKPTLNPDELRRGNLVYNIFYGHKMLMFIRGTLPNDNIITASSMDDDSTTFRHEPIFYEPVPITDEALIKIGFYITTGPYSDRHAFQIDKYIYSAGDLFQKYEDHFHFITEREHPTSEPILKYIHHLQNLYFELKRKELKINTKG
jgi:hypothetical protein